MTINEVICISCGDSRRISTWSGVPFFHCMEMERQGIVVHRADIGLPDWRLSLWDKTFRRFMKIFCHDNMLDGYRSFISYLRLSWTVFVETHKHKSAAAVIIYGTPPFWQRVTKLPVIYLGDWPFSYFIEEKQHRQPDFFERRYIAKETKCINNSALTISLFDNCVDYMRTMCSSKANIRHIPGNVINCAIEPAGDVILRKRKMSSILFVGRNHYLKGLEMLMDALPTIRRVYPDIILHVIGISPEMVSGKGHDDVIFHGYLHKEIQEECSTFYDLLADASVIVNPNPEWAGYSSLIEAMYYYTPVVVSSFETFVRDFGSELDFGMYCSKDDVADKILEVLESEKYESYCISSHKRVESFTWNNYTCSFLEQVKVAIIGKKNTIK